MNRCTAYKKIDFQNQARHVISVETPTEVTDDMGGFDRTWSELASMYAIIEPMSQNENFKYSGMNSNVSHKIIVRYQPIFSNPLTNATYRIIFNSRKLEITEAINLFEDNRYIKIMATEVFS